MHHLREARQSLVSFTVNGCLCSTTIPYREGKAWSLGLICLALSCELSEWALLLFLFELGWGFKHWSHSCLAQRPWCKVDGALYEIRPLEGVWSRFHHYQFLTKSSLLSTPAEKLLYLFLFLFFPDTDPHLASVVCDLYLFSVSRYELCVCGNMCSCVHVSTNLESPPTMGNFEVWLGTYV